MPIKGFPPSHKAATDKGRGMGCRLRSAGYAVTSWEAGKGGVAKLIFCTTPVSLLFKLKIIIQQAVIG